MFDTVWSGEYKAYKPEHGKLVYEDLLQLDVLWIFANNQTDDLADKRPKETKFKIK